MLIKLEKNDVLILLGLLEINEIEYNGKLQAEIKRIKEDLVKQIKEQKNEE